MYKRQTFLGAKGINIGALHMGAPDALAAGAGAAVVAAGSKHEALALYQVSRALTASELDALRTLQPIAGALGVSLEG